MNKRTLSDLGLDVRKARKERKWSQAELAKVAAVATTLVGRLERGQPVSDTTIKAVARALDLPNTAITPHLTDQPAAPRPAAIDPNTGTLGDLQRELAYFHRRLRDTPEDFERLLDLLALSDRLGRSYGGEQDQATQGGLGMSADSEKPA